MAKRKSVSKKSRFDVFKRDGFMCQYCGRTPPAIVLHVDHINPVSKGGDNHTDNLITSCHECNIGKSSALLEDIPKSLKDKAKEIKERELQIAGYNEILIKKRNRIEAESWHIVEILERKKIESYDVRSFRSIKVFLNRLPFMEVVEAAEMASAKMSSSYSAFRYFCGICWKKIKVENQNA